MKFMVRMAVLFYSTMIMFLGCLLIVLVMNWVSLTDVMTTLYVTYYDEKLRLIVGIVAVGFLVLNYFLANAVSEFRLRGKNLAFDNPAGRVTLSVLALEDLVRRVISRTPEVKDVRSRIHIGKKGLKVHTRIILNADVNIPETTARLQDAVKRRLQDTIGLDESVYVQIHVDKIIPNKPKGSKLRLPHEEDPARPAVPFEGYRA